MNRIEEISMKEKQGKENFNTANGNTGGACGLATPIYGYPQSSDTDLYSQVQIVCCGGNLTTNPVTPCADFPPSVCFFYFYFILFIYILLYLFIIIICLYYLFIYLFIYFILFYFILFIYLFVFIIYYYL